MAGSREKDAAGTEEQDDDYIAQLLAKDARECSLRYSAMGMYASASPRPAGRVPKPNTRFLKNVLRDTDAHNANLKRKEEEEARERMKRLRQKSSKITKADSSREGVDEREPKRRRVESPRDRDRDRERPRRSRHRDDRKDASEETRKRGNESRKHERSRHGTSHGDELSKTSRHKDGRRSENDRGRHDRRQRSRRGRSREQSQDAEQASEDEKRHSRKSRRSSRSHSPRRKRSRSPHHPRRQNRPRSRERDGHSRERTPAEKSGGCHGATQLESASPARLAKNTRPAEAESPHDPNPDSDDDPLSNLIGPLPPSASDKQPMRCRGRGAYKANGSNIDSHFAAGYDPALDVHPDEDEDEARIDSNGKTGSRRPVPGLTTDADDIDNDWDMALEALRDRAVWRRKGADRLLQAGFDQKVVERWSNSANFLGLRDNGGGAESTNMRDVQDKDLADMRWAKKGEGREWDRGKVVDEEGHVDVKAPW